jgi:hypothetical protein
MKLEESFWKINIYHRFPRVRTMYIYPTMLKDGPKCLHATVAFILLIQIMSCLTSRSACTQKISTLLLMEHALLEWQKN